MKPFNWIDFMQEQRGRKVEAYGNPKETPWPWLSRHIVTQSGRIVPVAKPKSYVSYKAPTLGNEAFQCEARHCEEKTDA